MEVLGQGSQQTLAVLQLSPERAVLLSMLGVLAVSLRGVRSPQMGVLGQGSQQTLAVLQLSPERAVLLSMLGVLAVSLRRLHRSWQS